MEVVGTFFLVLVVALTGNPMAIAGTLAAMIYIGAHVSGGQYNPAVSIGLSVANKQSWDKTLRYILAQLGGALFAVYVASLLDGKLLSVAPADGVMLYQAIIAEALFTFALVTAVFHAAVSKQAEGNSYFGLAIGLTVLAGAYSVGTFSGGAFNPAVGLAPHIVGVLMGKPLVIEHVLLYIIGPVLGGVLAAQFYDLTHAPEKHNK